MLPNEENELLYQIALTFIPGVGPKTVRALLSKYESASEIFKAPIKELKNAAGVGEVRAKLFRDKEILSAAEKELEYALKHETRLLFFNSEDYPKRLHNCDDPPVLLYYKGNANLNTGKIIAVIGTRKNTDYGQRVCESLVEGLRGLDDLLIVSGLALGIDTIAHKASLRNIIPTVGVMGHSLDRIYPYSNKALGNEMLQLGGLLSEFPFGTKPDRQNFPVRNRVVAGMSDITVVVESDIKGGAMITAYLAHGYNREVAAFPGRVFDSKSEGPNHLIKKNIAACISGADDLLELMNWGRNEQKKSVQKQLFLDLVPDEKMIIDLMQTKDALHSDELLIQTGFTSPQLAAVLLQLEMQGLIKALPGKNYRLN